MVEAHFPRLYNVKDADDTLTTRLVLITMHAMAM